MTVHQSPTKDPHDNVDQQAAEVISFWFGAGPARWFARDDQFDADIADRFGPLREAVVESQARAWRSSPERLLAAIIIIDQFGRNMFRGDGKAFADDPLALNLAFHGLDQGWTHAAPAHHRQFMLLPLMHSEALDVQQRSLIEFALMNDDKLLDYAQRHHDQIRQFGRFPGRNAALGRLSTPAEQAVIDAGETF